MHINMSRKNKMFRIAASFAITLFVITMLFVFTGCSSIPVILESLLENSIQEKTEATETEAAKTEATETEAAKTEATETVETSKAASVEEKKPSDQKILAEFDAAISTVAEQVKPSVVNVKVIVTQEDGYGNSSTGEGVGSGIIFSSDGYIITNNHVVGDASEVIVTLNDGKEYTAKLAGTDPNTDIAVIKIEATGLKPAEFVSVDDIKVGELAIAVGSPFGLQQTVTQGVVSAIGRDLSVSADMLPMLDLIQTDAAINPGNSGGALVNSAGQVMGINTIIFSTSGSSAGIGFAIPSDIALNIANQIIKTGKAQMAFMGIEMSDSTNDVKGVLVSSTIPGYPAEKAGIKAGDTITEFDGKKIENRYQLLAQVIRHNPGDTVNVKVYRDGGYIDFNVTLTSSPQDAS